MESNSNTNEISGAIMHFNDESFDVLQNKMLSIHTHKYLQTPRDDGGPSGEMNKDVVDDPTRIQFD